ncbi:MAG: adenylosuccinate synthetase [Candidatus Nezhaarchaeales archaeon]
MCAYLSLRDDVRVAVRTGSVNAGHTVTYNGVEYKLRMIPCGFVNPNAILCIAAGANIRIDVLMREIELTKAKDRLKIDPQASIIEDEHVKREREDAYLISKIGSTGQGVGAAMADRVRRVAKLARDVKELEEYLDDVLMILWNAYQQGHNILLEGTQGYYLSLYHGTYPYVTSRDTTASAICSEVGIGPKMVDEVIVVFKSYVTRVGGGPLPGELSEEETEERGLIEIATVTGRRRRVAPFNFDLARRAVLANSATQIALTRVDTLFPAASKIRDYDKLPREAKKFIEEIESTLKVPVTIISTGPDVFDTIDLRRLKGL